MSSRQVFVAGVFVLGLALVIRVIGPDLYKVWFSSSVACWCREKRKAARARAPVARDRQEWEEAVASSSVSPEDERHRARRAHEDAHANGTH